MFAPTGSYSTTITFNPSPELRHVTADQEGFVYALGMDSAYLRGRAQECLLVHKFAPDGKRLTAFSECPDNQDHRVRTGINMTANPFFQNLRQEADRGQLWIIGGLVHHVLPVSRLLRVFDSTGHFRHETRFTPPSESEVLVSPFALGNPVDNRWIAGVWPVGSGRYLVQWRISARGHRRSYYALHGPDGKTVSQAKLLQQVAPVDVDESGTVYFLRDVLGQPGMRELVPATVTAR